MKKNSFFSPENGPSWRYFYPCRVSCLAFKNYHSCQKSLWPYLKKERERERECSSFLWANFFQYNLSQSFSKAWNMFPNESLAQESSSQNRETWKNFSHSTMTEGSVTSKKSPNVYKSCPKNISLLKCGRFGKINCCQRLWKVAQSAINRQIWSHWLKATVFQLILHKNQKGLFWRPQWSFFLPKLTVQV